MLEQKLIKSFMNIINFWIFSTLLGRVPPFWNPGSASGHCFSWSCSYTLCIDGHFKPAPSLIKKYYCAEFILIWHELVTSKCRDQYGLDYSPLVITDVSCRSDEQTILQCSYATYVDSDCYKDNDDLTIICCECAWYQFLWMYYTLGQCKDEWMNRCSDYVVEWMDDCTMVVCLQGCRKHSGRGGQGRCTFSPSKL